MTPITPIKSIVPITVFVPRELGHGELKQKTPQMPKPVEPSSSFEIPFESNAYEWFHTMMASSTYRDFESGSVWTVNLVEDPNQTTDTPRLAQIVFKLDQLLDDGSVRAQLNLNDVGPDIRVNFAKAQMYSNSADTSSVQAYQQVTSHAPGFDALKVNDSQELTFKRGEAIFISLNEVIHFAFYNQRMVSDSAESETKKQRILLLGNSVKEVSS